MAVTSFRFHDEVEDWTLEETAFAPDITLLVGASGVGKTRILDALQTARRAGLGPTIAPMAGRDWDLEAHTRTGRYLWHVHMASRGPRAAPGSDDRGNGERADGPAVEQERLELTGHKPAIIERKPDSFCLNGSELPQGLKADQSAVSLFESDEWVAPFHTALSSLNTASEEVPSLPVSAEDVLTLDGRFASLEALRQSTADVHTVVGAYHLARLCPGEYAAAVLAFQTAFDTVTDVRVGLRSEMLGRPQSIGGRWDWLTVGIRERGVSGWVTGTSLSDGMWKTLSTLFRIRLAPSGSTIMVDEFENSLGVNCLPELTEQILDRAGEVQFILTSHHPYVINKIPVENWSVVVRSGSTVRCLRASEIPELRGWSRSHHEAFQLLLQSEAYRHGTG